MAKGLAIPVRVNRRGGALLREGEVYLKQTISVGLTPNTSRNPFQRGGGIDLGIDERVIFAKNDATAEGLGRRTIVRFFARLRAAELAKLSAGRDSIRFTRSQNGGDGTLTISVKYVNVESDQEREVDSNLVDALRSSPDLGRI